MAINSFSGSAVPEKPWRKQLITVKDKILNLMRSCLKSSSSRNDTIYNNYSHGIRLFDKISYSASSISFSLIILYSLFKFSILTILPLYLLRFVFEIIFLSISKSSLSSVFILQSYTLYFKISRRIFTLKLLCFTQTYPKRSEHVLQWSKAIFLNFLHFFWN